MRFDGRIDPERASWLGHLPIILRPARTATRSEKPAFAVRPLRSLMPIELSLAVNAFFLAESLAIESGVASCWGAPANCLACESAADATAPLAESGRTLVESGTSPATPAACIGPQPLKAREATRTVIDNARTRMKSMS